MTITSTRRERIRAGMRDEIKAIARQQMLEGGTAAISLNGIARAMDVTSPALYRYYASRDELVTALILDNYSALATALAEAANQHPIDAYGARLFDTSLAYRAWALANPTDFLLIYGNPIPGYQAPSEQVMAAAQQVYAVFLTTMQLAYQAGHIPIRSNYQDLVVTLCSPVAIAQAAPIAPIVMLAGIAAWTKLHGMVMLELLGHATTAIAQPQLFYRLELQQILADLALSYTPPPIQRE
jgi:AcrR family transcriptional regulator